MTADTERPRPNPLVEFLFKVPVWLYRWNLGWVLGHRFLMVTHRGRKSGLERRSVLEVIRYDPEHRESVVMSGFGPKSDWYLNIQAHPAIRIDTGAKSYVPRQRILTPEECRQEAIVFHQSHPWVARLAAGALVAIGAVAAEEATDGTALMASLPMVAFRP